MGGLSESEFLFYPNWVGAVWDLRSKGESWQFPAAPVGGLDLSEEAGSSPACSHVQKRISTPALSRIHLWMGSVCGHNLFASVAVQIP